MAVDVALQFELEDLYSRYASLLDDGPLRDWPDLFAQECLYLVIPRDNYDRGLPLAIIRCESRGMLVDRVRAAQETIMHEPRYLRHHVTNLRVTAVDGARIDAIAHFSVMEVLPDELPRILCVGRYIDVLQRRDDGA
ncbi:MAG TPA: nuclear transport factor 2 family protein, partial [Pseudomonadales bacterium]|nr:nuclear transport factor 2 family protein [Pseudomonadales bacterium]